MGLVKKRGRLLSMKFCFIESELNSFSQVFNNFKIIQNLYGSVGSDCLAVLSRQHQNSHVSSVIVFYILWEFFFLVTECNILLIITLQTKKHLHVLGTKSC